MKLLGRVFVEGPITLGTSAEHYPVSLTTPPGYYEVVGEFNGGRLVSITLVRIV